MRENDPMRVAMPAENDGCGIVVLGGILAAVMAFGFLFLLVFLLRLGWTLGGP